MPNHFVYIRVDLFGDIIHAQFGRQFGIILLFLSEISCRVPNEMCLLSESVVCPPPANANELTNESTKLSAVWISFRLFFPTFFFLVFVALVVCRLLLSILLPVPQT